jgi:hypothetical protein
MAEISILRDENNRLSELLEAERRSAGTEERAETGRALLETAVPLSTAHTQLTHHHHRHHHHHSIPTTTLDRRTEFSGRTTAPLRREMKSW